MTTLTVPKLTYSNLQAQIMTLLQSQGTRGVSGMDAMRSLGVSGGSFTKRISELRQKGIPIYKRGGKDPLTGRAYSRWYLGNPQAHV